MACAASNKKLRGKGSRSEEFALDVGALGNIGEFVDDRLEVDLEDLVKKRWGQCDVQILGLVDCDLFPFDPAKTVNTESETRAFVLI